MDGEAASITSHTPQSYAHLIEAAFFKFRKSMSRIKYRYDLALDWLLVSEPRTPGMAWNLNRYRYKTADLGESGPDLEISRKDSDFGSSLDWRSMDISAEECVKALKQLSKC